MFGIVQSSRMVPEWQSTSHFTANIELKDRIYRIANDLFFVSGFYGIYAICAGISGLGLYLSCAAAIFSVRKIGAAVLGHAIYPASLTSYPCVKERFNFEIEGLWQGRWLQSNGYDVRKITLHKSGTNYDAYLISHPSTEKTGRFAIHALGNCMTMEHFMIRLAKEDLSQKCTTLLINGPAVGLSRGWPTQYQMGAGFEAGLQFLERVAKASHIVMKTFSLGNGMMSEAILQHDFTEGMKRKIRYLCISQCSFSRLSTIAKALIGRVAKPVLFVVGLDLEGVEAARKLSDLGIAQIIVQHRSNDDSGSDGIIPDRTSLAFELRKDPLLKKKIFIESEHITHTHPLPKAVQNSLNQNILQFFKGGV